MGDVDVCVCVFVIRRVLMRREGRRQTLGAQAVAQLGLVGRRELS